MSGLDGNLIPMACALVAGGIIARLLWRSWRYFRRRPQDEKPLVRVPRPSKNSLPLHDAPRDLLRWQVELHEVARDVKAELDTKIRVLQQTIRLAREENDRLESLIRRAIQLDLVSDGDTLQRIERLAAEMAGDFTRPLALDDLPDVASPLEGTLPVTEDRRKAIYSLTDSGESAASIADRMALPVGDVEIALSLRGKES